MATNTTPLVVRKSRTTVPVAADADGAPPAIRAPFAGTITGVTYTAKAAVTGNDTETRTLAIANKGQAGIGTTAVASLALVTDTNLVANDEKAITLSATAANLVVAEGDILAFTSTHGGTTGLADPGGLLIVTFTRAT